MAEQIVSPGVFTRENDLSFLPAGIGAIGAAIVGPTVKGPAFVPTIITSYSDYQIMFGGLSEETYVPYAVKSYLSAASTVTVVRVLQQGGYNAGVVGIIHTTGSTSYLVGAILPTTQNSFSDGKNFSGSTFPTSVSATGSSFGFTLLGGGITAQSLSGSGDPTNASSFYNILGTSVKGAKKGYLYVWFDQYLTTSAGKSGSLSFVTASGVSVNLSGSTFGSYSGASTPYIVSQNISGENIQLFKFTTLADGTDTNTSAKVSIINTVLPGDDPATDYGSFTVLVRAFNDTDQKPVVLETYTNCNIDPDSSNYIARRIGDKYYTVDSDGILTLNGNYDNVSKYVRVVTTTNLDNKAVTPNAKPFGFEGFATTVAVQNYTLPPVSTITQNTVINGLYSKKAYYGVDFNSTDNLNWFKPLPSGSTTPANTTFNLDNCFVHPSASKADTNSTFSGGSSISGSTFAGVDIANFLKFTIAMQGGFDGDDPAVPKKVGADIVSTNVFGLDCSTASSKGSVAYVKGLNAVANGEQFDINMVVTPGINVADHSVVVNKAIEVVEDRGDAFVVVDPVTYGGSVASAVQAIADSGIDSSYAATYWPWVKILDTDKNKPVWVPPSVVLPKVIAYNDNVSYEWFAPAGLNRGSITEAIDIERRLSTSDKDTLYANKVNPIATFPNQGIVVFGQKTLQAKPSALDRINVRRLLITLKKYIASSTRYLVFENNTTATRQRFLNIVNPYLETVKARQGVYAYKVVMDETNNTPDVIDRNEMYGQIYIQPAKAAEFIILDFNITPTGASFEQ